MADKRQVRTMSVELAIKRELAYRKKVASMLPDAQAAEFLRGLMPLELPSSSKSPNPNQYLRDQPWPSSVPGASHQELSPTLNPGPKRGQTSEISMVPLDQVSPSAPMSKPLPVPRQVARETSLSRAAPMHTSTCSGTKRKLTASSFTWRPPRPPASSDRMKINKPMPGNYVCKVCQVGCSGFFNYKQHLSGHKHRAKQKLLRQGRGGFGENEIQRPTCNLCRIQCTDQNCLSMHFNGQKHKAKVQELELRQENAEITSAKQFWCELCQVPCTNEDTFMLHLSGRNHAARAHTAEMKKKAKI